MNQKKKKSEQKKIIITDIINLYVLSIHYIIISACVCDCIINHVAYCVYFRTIRTYNNTGFKIRYDIYLFYLKIDDRFIFLLFSNF